MKYETPINTIDVLIVTIKDGKPHLMISKRDNQPFRDFYSLIGGFVFTNEDQTLEDTVSRVLKHKLGIENIYFEQLGTFGSKTRDPRGWSVSTIYISLLPWNKAQEIKPEETIKDLKWVSFDEISELNLAFDHKDIIKNGISRLISKINYSSLPIYLLPELFTITQLQEVYETFLGVKLDKSGFRKKIKDFTFLKETEKTTNNNHRPAKLYTAINESDNDLSFFKSNIL
jgi:ADP-ribose pyrophosphatase YjhB (NUDIX family)